MVYIFEAIVALAAVYGAALSTYIYFKNRRSEKSNILVTHGWTYSKENDHMDQTPASLTLHATNHGKRDVVVESLCLEIPNLCLITPNFLNTENAAACPSNVYSVNKTRLIPSDRIDISFDYKKLIKVLQSRGLKTPMKVRAVCEDSLDNFYFSVWFNID